jgi:hypothetical protein
MEMINEKMMLGDVNLKDYIKTVSQDERKSWQDTLDKLKKDNLRAEKIFVEELEEKLRNSSEYSEYPMMDVSFLKKTSKITNPLVKKSEMVVPAFGVCPFYGSNNMVLEYSLRINPHNKALLMDVHISNEYSIMYESEMRRGICKSEDFKGVDTYALGLVLNSFWKSRKLIKKYFGKNEELAFKEGLRATCYFNGLVPDETKEKVKKAKKVFGENFIFLIWEAKPENWTVKKYKTDDPLIVGVESRGAHFIDHFNCTPLENAIVNNYVGGRLN